MTLSTVPPPDVLLPDHPTLLPGIHVLERDDDEVQFGLDPRHGVVAGGLVPQVVEIVRRLDGRRGLDDLMIAVGEHRDQLHLLLKQLTALGLVTEAPRQAAKRIETGLWSLRARHHQTALTDRRRQSLVAVHGSGRLAVAVAVLLANAGVGHLDIRAAGTVTEADLGSGLTTLELGQLRRRAILTVLARMAPEVSTARNHRRSPDLVLLTDTLVPPPEEVAELVEEGIPHLPVRVREGTGIVGPLVVPGRSACLRCCDLHRTDMDSSWPRVASQLVGKSQRPDLGAVQACAALAVAQAMRLLSPSDEPPPTWNTTLEIDNFEGRVHHEDWEPHPDCGCGAPVAVDEDEPEEVLQEM
ncbi:TOMM precursor leader peptide-binding protein [Amycolatopsis jiangsuensis]|uniref:Bacteriocin biosynthesis cyclodehydratase domain-containing protein n=1 Tax=Amycolatopsis jiangsuensis TaxID=1181879 RepID=A0A840IVM7_9PSEU|nr:TOMM precursor leader peptide-binding protein [Amycolatopsis jiangsuensis]MBB4685920.1 bacteriocin biosynthesis cyclodehydratase domain-containing protein [Amycolatopsis jiangsuensis]